MKIKSRPFGEIEVRDEDVLNFPEGLIGFEEYTRYVLLSVPEEQPFSWLQSVDDPGLAFVVVSPLDVLGAAFSPNVIQADLEAMGAAAASELIYYCIVVVPEDPAQMTVNLKGPLVFVEKEKRGKQIILLNEEYTVRHLLLELMQEQTAAEGGEG